MRARRKLTPNQIKFFGTARQKAALKASRRRKRNIAHRSRTNPVARAAPRSRPKARKRHRNPGGIVEIALNPAPTRRTTVAQTKRKKARRRTPQQAHRGRRRNPVTSGAPYRKRKRNRHSTRRRNPDGGLRGIGNWVTAGAWAIAGAIGSKFLTQAVLGTGNVGWIGYGGNLVAAFALGTGVGTIMKNKQAQNAIILGGVIQTLLRFAIDKTPFGARLSTLGVGDYQASTFLSPARYLDPLRSAAVDIPTALRPLPTIVPANAGVSGVGAGSYARTASSY